MSGGVILWGINLVYFLAFGSLYIQLPGLVGDDGVAPVRLLDLSNPKTLEDFVLGIPSIIRFRDSFKLSAYHSAELLVLIGLSLSFFSLAAPQLRGTLSLVIQWISFFSVVKICPSYANWRFTSILVETGFLCILLSIKLRRSPNPPTSGIVIWLMRWLLFREAVTTGYTKLTRSSYSWWDLSAMEHYFTNQPLPAPMAWYVQTTPSVILRSFTATIIVFDVFVSFLFLVPIRGLQIFSFVFKFLMHANMMVSGNYGIYNILSIVLSFALLPPPPPAPLKKRKQDSSTCRKAASWAVTLAVLAVMFYGVWIVFGLHEGLKALRIVIPRHAFVSYAKRVMSYTIPISTALFIFTIIAAAFRALRARGCMNKMLDFSGVLLVGLLGFGLFTASLAPLSNLEDSGSVVPLPRLAHELTAALKPLHLANDYRYYHELDTNVLMKTPAEGRPTLVLEGAMNENGPWKELSFYHVPDRLEKTPTIIPGHLPVVDLEVFLSGDKSFENSPILATLVYRILNKQKEVLQLIEPTGFADGPKYIRIKKYTYQLSKSFSGKEWWQRKLKDTYLPPTHAASPRLTQLMGKLGITGRRRERPADATVVSASLDKIRAMVGQPHNLNGFYVVLLAVLLMNKLFF